MSLKLKFEKLTRLGGVQRACVFWLFAVLIFNSHATDATNSAAARLEPPPQTAREFYNAGTQMLEAKKLREAEAFLESCLGQQDERFQPPALYNLGHVRFAQGSELLKKAPDAGRATARAQGATWAGRTAVNDVDSALASHEMPTMVEAYLRGRGARRDLSAAIKAIQQALQAHGEVLAKWQRAAADFRSAAEMAPAKHQAQENADIVDRQIAKLIDEMRMMQQAMMAAAQMREQLGDKLKGLRGQIPDDAMPPGAPGEGEEEDEGDLPKGLEPGMKEGASKSGEEQPLSPEEAGQLLNGFRLDGERRLPMGDGKQATPKSSNRKTW
jgi:tetratricopeptide (TPR) repeat protein